MAKLKPLAGHVVVKRLEEEAQTASGIVLADSAKEKPHKGTVVSVGPAKDGVDPQVKEGQVVFFKQYGPREIDVDGEELLIVEEADILAIYEK